MSPRVQEKASPTVRLSSRLLRVGFPVLRHMLGEEGEHGFRMPTEVIVAILEASRRAFDPEDLLLLAPEQSSPPWTNAPFLSGFGLMSFWYRTGSLPHSSGDVRPGCTVEGRGRGVTP